MLEIDLSAHLETNTGFPTYPIKIPQNANYPAIVYSEVSNVRSPYSDLNKNNLRDLRYQITVVTPDSAEAILTKEQLITLYEGFVGLIGDSDIFNARVISSIPLFDNAQQNFEYSVDVVFTEKQ